MLLYTLVRRWLVLTYTLKYVDLNAMGQKMILRLE